MELRFEEKGSEKLRFYFIGWFDNVINSLNIIKIIINILTFYYFHPASHISPNLSFFNQSNHQLITAMSFNLNLIPYVEFSVTKLWNLK